MSSFRCAAAAAELDSGAGNSRGYEHNRYSCERNPAGERTVTRCLPLQPAVAHHHGRPCALRLDERRSAVCVCVRRGLLMLRLQLRSRGCACLRLWKLRYATLETPVPPQCSPKAGFPAVGSGSHPGSCK